MVDYALRAAHQQPACTGWQVAAAISSRAAEGDACPCAQPLVITMRGITNDDVDPSVDAWRAVTLPLLRQVTGAEGGFDLKINRRGAPPLVPPEVDPHVVSNPALP